MKLKLRDNIMRQRIDVISSVRFTLKRIGIVVRSPNTNCFARYARNTLQEEQIDILQLI